MSKTVLNKWHDVINEGDTHTTYTRDSWEIPEEGTEIWCTGWKRGQTIKPYGDGTHVIVGIDVYHNDQLMEILDRWVADGFAWGLDGVSMTREQQIDGRWENVKV